MRSVDPPPKGGGLADAERTEILSKKKLVIAPWDQSKELIITDPNESTAKALKRYSIKPGRVPHL